MKKILSTFIFIFCLSLGFTSHAYATASFTENFDSYNVNPLGGQGTWYDASPSGHLLHGVMNSYPISAPRTLRIDQAQNMVLPSAVYSSIGSLPATGVINLAMNLRPYLLGYTERVGLLDSNNYPICTLGQISPSSTAFGLEIPYSALNANWGYTVGDTITYGSGITSGVYYYPIVQMNFSDRNCKLSLDNGQSWSSPLQFYSGAATGSATINRVYFSHPATSTSPSYGSYVWYVDGVTVWTGGVASPPDVNDIEISAFSATDSGYLTYNLSGHVGYQSGNLTACEVDVYQQDIYNNSPMFYNAGMGFEGTVVLWNSNLVDYTQKFPNNVYIGHGYSTTSDAWSVEGFKIHYYNSQNTSLKFDYSCYEQYGTGNDVQVYHSQGVNPDSPDYDAGMISTPSGLLNQPTAGVTYCGDDWLCNVKEWISSFFQWLFMPKLSSMMTNSFVTLAETKAPFAYLTAVSGLNWTFSNSTSSALPTFNIVMNQVRIDKGDPSISFGATVPEVARPLFNWIRTASTVIFWLLFVIYITTVGRRLFK